MFWQMNPKWHVNPPGNWWDALMASLYCLLIPGLTLDQGLKNLGFFNGIWKALVKQKHLLIRGWMQNCNGLHH